MSTEDEPQEESKEDAEGYREVPAERESLGRGPEVLREQLRKAAERKKQVTIRLDADIVARFKELAGPDGSYQTLINRALREWLDAGSIRELLRDEFEAIDRKLEKLESDEGDAA